MIGMEGELPTTTLIGIVTFSTVILFLLVWWQSKNHVREEHVSIIDESCMQESTKR